MFKRIFKYPLEVISDDQHINMPTDAEILDIQNQDGSIVLWALVNPEPALYDCRRFRIFATGQEIPFNLNLKYIGTVQTDSLVWHVFERV